MSQTPLDPAGLSWQPCLGRTKDEEKGGRGENEDKSFLFSSTNWTELKRQAVSSSYQKPAISERLFRLFLAAIFLMKTSLQIAPHPLTLCLSTIASEDEERLWSQRSSSLESGASVSSQQHCGDPQHRWKRKLEITDVTQSCSSEGDYRSNCFMLGSQSSHPKDMKLSKSLEITPVFLMTCHWRDEKQKYWGFSSTLKACLFLCVGFLSL